MTRKPTQPDFQDEIEEVSKGSILIVIAILIVAAGITFGWAPIERWLQKYQTETRDEAFRESTAHVEGSIQNLQEFYLEVTREDLSPERKVAIERMAITEAAGLDLNDTRVPEYIRAWMNNLTKTPSTK